MLTTLGTKQWSEFMVGNPPCGRIGHTMSLIGSSLYVFGGETKGDYHHDLHVLDLDNLRIKDIKWIRDPYNMSTKSTSFVPFRRTRHTMVTWNNKLYLYVSKPCH